MIASLNRILLCTFIFIIWFGMALLPRLARSDGGGDHNHKEKHPPVVTQTIYVQAPSSNDRRLENALGAAIISGLATTALRDKEYGALKAIALSIAGAAAIEAAHSGSFEGKNFAWAIGGAVIGSVGVCQIYFQKNFVGCAVPFEMITPEEYFRKPHSAEQEAAARNLIHWRNKLRAEWMLETGVAACPKDPDTGTEISGKQGGDGDGGFRTPGSKTGAADSSHRIAEKPPKGAGIDDYDPDDAFDTWLDSFETPPGQNTKLAEYGLYREHRSVTPGWCHLTTRAPGSGRRTFMR